MPVSESMLTQMRGVAIAGAGLCTAIVLLLVQTGASSMPLLVALCAAALGIPAWLIAWQYVQPYIVMGARSYAHFSLRVAGFLGLIGMLLLFVALASLVWQLSKFVALVFIVGCAIAAIFARLHIRSVLSR